MEKQTVLVVWYDGNAYRATMCLTEHPQSSVPAMFETLDGTPLEVDISDEGGSVTIVAVVATTNQRLALEHAEGRLLAFIDEQPVTL